MIPTLAQFLRDIGGSLTTLTLCCTIFSFIMISHSPSPTSRLSFVDSHSCLRHRLQGAKHSVSEWASLRSRRTTHRLRNHGRGELVLWRAHALINSGLLEGCHYCLLPEPSSPATVTVGARGGHVFAPAALDFLEAEGVETTPITKSETPLIGS